MMTEKTRRYVYMMLNDHQDGRVSTKDTANRVEVALATEYERAQSNRMANLLEMVSLSEVPLRLPMLRMHFEDECIMNAVQLNYITLTYRYVYISDSGQAIARRNQSTK